MDDEFEFLVLASDGLWDVVPNEDAISIAKTEEEPEAAARKLTETAFTRGSADNITCIVVRFHHDKPESEKLKSDKTESDRAESDTPESASFQELGKPESDEPKSAMVQELGKPESAEVRY